MSVKVMGKVAQYKPYYTELTKGKLYLWCSCGLSKTQPFCDQSHVGTEFRPVRYIGQRDGEEVLFCGCKQTKSAPFCDGEHNNIKNEYDNDDPDSAENGKVEEVFASENGRAVLNGNCYVTATAGISLETYGNIKIGTLISAETGAKYQSQYYLEASSGQSTIFSFFDRHVIALVTQGEGVITISGRDFAIAPEMGIYIQPGEAFSIENTGAETIKLFASVCPVSAGFRVLDAMPDNFSEHHPDRIVETDAEGRNRMANRFWQILVDKNVGCTMATQFIGEIPESKALPHRHLYEESLVILQGSGYMWTEDYKTKVTAGDIIFLPRKQVHSLQCTDPGGMYLVGVIYPGDNPSINY